MLLATLAAAILLQQGTPEPAPLDTLPFDSPATGLLVERVIRAGSTVPDSLLDYRADFRSAVYLSLRSDSAQGGEVPVTIDEFAGELRWERTGALLQQVTGHRVRMLTPTPYTLGTLLENVWIVPHLYGHTIDLFQLSPTRPTSGRRVSRAVHPFSPRGPDLYRYEAGDSVRVATPEGVVTLVEIVVLPRALPEEGRQVVAGSFYVDVDRAAIARARFGFAQRAGRFSLSRTGVFFEMENGLVQGRYWLPYRQRQEVQITSPLFGGATAVRVASSLSGYDLNTGWTPPPGDGRIRLVREPGADGAFREWDAPVGEEFADYDIADFDDLLRATGMTADDADAVRFSFFPRRINDVFRFNRVEGLFLGAAGEMEIPLKDALWEVYATAGWAFAEGAARGEANLQRTTTLPSIPGVVRAWSASLGAFRRLSDAQAFRPTSRWPLGYTLAAALGGYDILDYYDASGVEAQAGYRNGPWSTRIGARFERHDSVTRNTERFAFGRADDFPPISPADPGDHAGVDGELRFARGAGAFTIGNSLITSLRGEAGLGSWRFARVTGLVTGRREMGLLTLLTRIDAGTVLGDPPTQFLFRVGEAEGLRGYEPNEFGGTTAALGRARLLFRLPPYGEAPLARVGYFIIPPLRPALALGASAAWTGVREGSEDELRRIRGTTTEAPVGALSAGVSFFDDTFVIEWSRPLDEADDGRWYFGLVQWF